MHYNAVDRSLPKHRGQVDCIVTNLLKLTLITYIMNNTLTFIRTVSVNRFKAINGVEHINIIKGKEDKKFFACPEDSALRGAISSTTDFSKPIVISTVVSTEDGSEFYLMHNQANNDANVTATL